MVIYCLLNNRSMQYFPKNIIIFKNYITENFGTHYPIEIVMLIVQMAIKDYLIIDVSDTNKLNVLFQFVYASKIVDSDLFRGLSYYQNVYPWSGSCLYKRSGESFYHPDYVFLQGLCMYNSQNIFLIGYNEMNIYRDTDY